MINIQFILAALLNTWGGPQIIDRENKFPGKLDWNNELFEKLIKLRNAGVNDYHLSPEEKWIIYEAIKFVIREYPGYDFEALISMSPQEAEEELLKLEEFLKDKKKPGQEYSVI